MLESSLGFIEEYFTFKVFLKVLNTIFAHFFQFLSMPLLFFCMSMHILGASLEQDGKERRGGKGERWKERDGELE